MHQVSLASRACHLHNNVLHFQFSPADEARLHDNMHAVLHLLCNHYQHKLCTDKTALGLRSAKFVDAHV